MRKFSELPKSEKRSLEIDFQRFLDYKVWRFYEKINGTAMAWYWETFLSERKIDFN